jgi:thymidylate kinase
MQILIFEGIATSGKSTVTKQLVNTLSSNLNVRLASEDETHVPIMNERLKLHVDFFEDLIESLTSNQPDLLMIDRLYMTQAFRARCNLAAYEGIENLLTQFNPTTIFLKVSEADILERIQKATEYRNPDWAEYVKSKGQKKEMAQYYIGQQRSQLELLKQSKIPYRIIDTTKHDYNYIVNQVIELVLDKK